MQLKTSLLNKGIFKNSLKRFYWMGVLYFIALFFMFPLSILLRLPSAVRNNRFTEIEGLFNFRTGPLPHFLIYIVPVFIAVLLFHYLQSKHASDMIHSLPIKRSTLYATHVLIGVLLIAIPVILTAIICWGLKLIYLSPHPIDINLSVWAATTILMNMVLFLSTVFAGVVTGFSIAQGIITYIVLLLPTGLFMLISNNLQALLFGFRAYYYNRDLFIRLSPLIKIAELHAHPLTLSNVIGYMTYCLVLYFVGRYLYNKRKLERGSQIIVFKSLTSLFKYGVTFCFMVLFGLYIYNIHGGFTWMLIGYIVASLFGYTLAEAILQKSARIFNRKTFKGYLVYFGVSSILLIAVLFDLTGYTSRVPKLDEIEAVYFNNGFYGYHSGQFNNSLNRQLYITPDNIELVQELHKRVLKAGSRDRFNTGYYSPDIVEASIVYHLQNDKKLVRGYRIDQREYEEFIKPLRESLEDKVIRFDVLSVDLNKVEKLTFDKFNYHGSNRLVIVDPLEIKEALEILQQEIRNASYEDLYDNRDPWANIDILLESPVYSDLYRQDIQFLRTPWLKNFKVFETWLTEKGYLERARVMPEEVNYVIIRELQSTEDMYYIESIHRNTNSRELKITDDDEIEDLLLNHHSRWRNIQLPGYAVIFYNTRNEVMFYGSYGGNDLPSFIEDYFN